MEIKKYGLMGDSLRNRTKGFEFDENVITAFRGKLLIMSANEFPYTNFISSFPSLTCSSMFSLHSEMNASVYMYVHTCVIHNQVYVYA